MTGAVTLRDFGQFAGYTRTAGGNSFVEPIACNKMPRHSNAPKAFAEAIASFAERVDLPQRSLVIVLDGSPTVEVNKEDLHTYRYQRFHAYSKEFKFAKNP